MGNLDGNVGNEVFVANDMTSNHFWSRIDDPVPNAGGDGTAPSSVTLGESAMLRGLGGDDRGIAQGSMGIATADFDGDGDLDLYVTNFDREYNTFHAQASAGIWQDRSERLGLVSETKPLVAFGSEAIDIDNSGTPEIVVANGHVDLFSRGDERVKYAQPLQIFDRTDKGDYRSIKVGTLGDYLSKDHVGRALWTIDANRDGRLDFVVTHQTEPTALVINRTSNTGNWVRLKLVGRNASRDAVGASVRVQSGKHEFHAFVVAGGGYQCSNESVLHIGLGEQSEPTVSVLVRWPTGVEESFKGVETSQTSVIVESATN